MSKTLDSVKAIVKTLKEEGSLKIDELKDRVGGSGRTFYRAKEALREVEVIIEKGGMCYWHEFVGNRVYKTELDAKQFLDHSKNIALGLKCLIQTGTYPKSDHKKSALMHLRTGYRNIYEIYKESEDIKKKAEKKEQTFLKKFKEKFLSLPPKAPLKLKPKAESVVGKIICEDIKEVLRGRKADNLSDLEVKGGKVKIGACSLAPKEKFEPLKAFITKEESSRDNRQSCRRIIKLENEYYNLRNIFEEEIEKIIMQIENGNPINGGCNNCPRALRIKS